MPRHEIIKTLTVFKLGITDGKLNIKYICHNISKKKEYLQIINSLNIFLNRKSKHAIKGAIPEIEKKQNKLT